MIPWFMLFGGLMVLSVGAHLLVKGGAALALRMGVSPLVIGLTVIAYGTSSPELIVSYQAAAQGSAAIAVGNVIGSNLCNLALILGLCALLRPVATSQAVIRREVPLLLGATVVSCLLLLDRQLPAWEGAVLLLALVVYTAVTVQRARRQPEKAARGDQAPAPLPLVRSIVSLVVGLALLLWGADRFVEGAVVLATGWGMSEALIGLTIIAIGTSLPELATTIAAVYKRSADMAIGSLVGSSLFNLLGVLGFVSVMGGESTGELRTLDLVALLVVTAMLLPLVRSGRQVSRGEGALLLSGYVGYTVWMVMRPA